jgi:hypothetical protein
MADRSDPLQALLGLLTQGAAYTLPGLAQRLDVQVPLLEEMLATLLRAGYVSCADLAGCACCPRGDCASKAREGAGDPCGDRDDTPADEHAQRGCGLVHGSRIWTVTDRGRRVGGVA